MKKSFIFNKPSLKFTFKKIVVEGTEKCQTSSSDKFFISEDSK